MTFAAVCFGLILLIVAVRMVRRPTTDRAFWGLEHYPGTSYAICSFLFLAVGGWTIVGLSGWAYRESPLGAADCIVAALPMLAFAAGAALMLGWARRTPEALTFNDAFADGSRAWSVAMIPASLALLSCCLVQLVIQIDLLVEVIASLHAGRAAAIALVLVGGLLIVLIRTGLAGLFDLQSLLGGIVVAFVMIVTLEAISPARSALAVVLPSSTPHRPLSSLWGAFALLGLLAHPALTARLPAARNVRRGRFVIGFSIVALIVVGAALVLGVAGTVWFPREIDGRWNYRSSALVDPNGVDFSRLAFAVIQQELPGAAVLAAVLASCSLIALAMLLHAIGLLLVRDIYRPLLRPRASLNEQKNTMRILLVLMAVLAVAVFLKRASPRLALAADYLREAAIVAPLVMLQWLPSIIFGIRWRWASRLACVAGAVAGVGVVLALSTPVEKVLARKRPDLLVRLDDAFAAPAPMLLSLAANLLVLTAIALILRGLFPRRVS